MAKKKSKALTVVKKKEVASRTFDAYEMKEIRGHEVACEAYEQFVEARVAGTEAALKTPSKASRMRPFRRVLSGL